MCLASCLDYILLLNNYMKYSTKNKGLILFAIRNSENNKISEDIIAARINRMEFNIF